MILSSIVYDFSTIEGMCNLILDITEMMLRVFIGKKLENQKTVSKAEILEESISGVFSLLPFISLFLRKLICVIFLTLISTDDSNCYLF